MRPEAAMVFAAGFGTRMKALTAHTPKPMLRAGKRPLIDHALGLLEGQGFSTIVVNTHYLAEQVESHLANRTDVTCIRETPDVLETGGGLKNALSVLGTGPVLTANSDVVFGQVNPVPNLLRQWNPDIMDALLVLIPKEQTAAHSGTGDFFCDAQGRLIRRGARPSAPYVYAGVQILKTDLLAKIDQRAFSLNLVWDEMIAKQRAFGMVHDHPWVDVGSPEGLEAAAGVLADV